MDTKEDLRSELAERILLEEAERASRVQYESLIQSIDGILWEADPKNIRFTFVSRQAERILGYPTQQWLTEPDFWLNHLHPEDRDQALTFCTDSTLKLQDHQFEYRMIAADGREVWLSDIVTVDKLDDGSVRLRGVMIDISERKRIEAAVLKEKELTMALLESLPGIFYLYDSQGKYLRWNKNLELVTGSTAEKLADAHPLDKISPEDHLRTQERVKEVFTKGQSTLEANLIRPDGSHTPYFFTGKRVYINGEPCLCGMGIDITERKRAEDENQRLMHDLTERVKELTALHETARILQGEWSGVEEMLQRWISIVPPSFQYPEITAARVSLGESEAMTAGFIPSPGPLRTEFKTADGQTGCIEVIYTEEKPALAEGPFLSEERSLIDTLADMLRSAYDSRQGELALLESEERYRDMVENAHDIIYSHDLEGNYISVNKAGERIMGYTHEETLHLNMTDAVAPEYVEKVKKMVADKLKGEQDTVYDIELITKDKRRLAVEINSHLVHENGVPVAIQGIARDVTERKRAEQNVMREKLLNDAIIDSLPGVFYLFNQKGQRLRWNRNLEKVTGYSSEELATQTIFSNIVDEDREELLQTFSEVFTNGHASGETYVQMNDGSRLPYFLTGRRVDIDGEPHLVGIGIDISERKRAEEELRKSEEQLRQAQKMEAIGQLAGGIAHDFNNLLTAINGYSELTLRKLPPGDPLAANIEEINKAGKRAAALTRQLLAFSRKQLLQPKVLDFNEVVSELEKMLRRLIGEDVELRTTLEPGLGRIKADPGQLEQVIMNLAVNARDAMPYGGELTIETKNSFLEEDPAELFAIKPGPYVLFTVSDTGDGMDKDIQSHIFEPFFTTKDQGKGTGLGLSTVYGIIKQSDGYIWVDSEPGQGTTFKIYLPRVDDAAEGYKQSGRELQEQTRGNETVLLVEDDEIVRNLVRDVVKSYGYKVLEASCGSEALEICRNDKIDLLLTDVIMPEMSGNELYRKLLEICPDVKIIFMSGYTDDAIIRHNILSSDVNFIQKPFAPSDLVRRIREVLDATE